MNPAKQRYYEALDRQTSAERVLEKNLLVGGDTVQDRPNRLKDESDDFRSLDLVYQELGIKAYSALTNCLDLLGRIGTSDSGRGVNLSAIQDMVTSGTSAAFTRLLSEIQDVKERLEQTESKLSAIEAGLKRIDRFTIEAFRELEEIKREADESRDAAGLSDRGRLAKDEAARLALEAGRRMQEQGKRLSLAAVAREAGLKYGQIVYAFGNKEAFFTELEKALSIDPESVEERAV